MIIIVIFIAWYLTDKGEHITLYMIKQNVYIILQKDIYTHIVIYSHDTHMHSHTCTHTHTPTHVQGRHTEGMQQG